MTYGITTEKEYKTGKEIRKDIGLQLDYDVQ